MSTARTTVARWRAWRRSSATLLAALAAASLTLASTGAAGVLGAQPHPRSNANTSRHQKPGPGHPKPSAAPSPSPTPAPSPSPSGDPANSGPSSKSDPKSNPVGLTADEQRTENVIAAAAQYLGIPYRIGTEGPTLFDCSGLVFRAFSDAGLVDRIGGERLRAAGYMRWFASRGRMTTEEMQAQRGDLVVYENGSHIGIYLGDGRVESALINPFGVTVHALHGVSLPVTGFLRPDWSGEGKVAPFAPVYVPDVPEAPVTLVPAADWMTPINPTIVAPATLSGSERPDMRTLNSRTFQNKDGSFTTEFHAQPIFYQPVGTAGPAALQPISLAFLTDEKTGYASVSTSPVAITARPADDGAGFLSASSGDLSVSLSLATEAGKASSKSAPQIVDAGRVIDYFDMLPDGVGLRVLAQTDGFKSFVVMGKAPNRTRFSFVLNAPGLTPSVADDGSVVLNDANGTTVGRIPVPLLLDSSDIDGSGGGLFTAATTLSVDTSGAAPVITVAVDRSYLDQAVFPAYLDLSLTDFPQTPAGADVAFASSGHPNANLHGFQRPESAGFDELWLGHQPASNNENEVFVRFAGLKSVLGTVDVASASLELLPYLQRADGGNTVVRRVTADWSVNALTWTTKPVTDDTKQLALKTTARAWASLDVSSYVSDVLSKGQPDFGLALTGGDSSAATWERLAASDAGGSSEFGPRLVVTWSGLRPSATVRPADATPAAPGIVPTLSWTEPQLAAAQVAYEVQVSHDDFKTIDVDSGTVARKNGALGSWTAPAGLLQSSGTYSWRVRAKYGTDKTWSAWATPQSFIYAEATHYVMTGHGAV